MLSCSCSGRGGSNMVYMQGLMAALVYVADELEIHPYRSVQCQCDSQQQSCSPDGELYG